MPGEAEVPRPASSPVLGALGAVLVLSAGVAGPVVCWESPAALLGELDLSDDGVVDGVEADGDARSELPSDGWLDAGAADA